MKKLILFMVSVWLWPNACLAIELPPPHTQLLNDSSAFMLARSSKLGRMNDNDADVGLKNPGKNRYECTSDTDCSMGSSCQGNRCVDPCAAKNCKETTPKCMVSGTAAKCVCEENSCAPAYKCLNGVCTICPAGEACGCPDMAKADGTGNCKELKYYCEGGYFVAAKDFQTYYAPVKKGEKGGTGCEETYTRLSQTGISWVHSGASVADSAQISGNAVIYSGAKVYGNAKIYDRAKIFNNAKVYGNAQIYEDADVSGPEAEVFGNAKIFGDAQVFAVATLPAKIYDRAQIYGYAYIRYSEISGDAKIYDRATVDFSKISENAKIYDYAFISGNPYNYAYLQGDVSTFKDASPVKIYGYAEVFGRSGVYSTKSPKIASEVYGHAKVFGEARIFCGYVYDNAQVSGNAKISCWPSGTPTGSFIYGNAKVSGIIVTGDSRIYGDAQIYSNGTSRYPDNPILIKSSFSGNARLCGIGSTDYFYGYTDLNLTTCDPKYCSEC